MSNYRKLDVWVKAHRLTLATYKATQGFPRAELFGLTSQIRRAASSIGANIAEGCARRGGDFSRFVTIAIGSSDELDYHLLLSRDLGYLKEAEYLELSRNNAEVGRMLSGLRQTISRRISSS